MQLAGSQFLDQELNPGHCSGGLHWELSSQNPPAMQEIPVQFLGQQDFLEEGMAIHSSIPAWRIPMNRGAWWATVYGVTKSLMQLSD